MVVPCNVDIATTEALKMAQEVDPDGERTLGNILDFPQENKQNLWKFVPKSYFIILIILSPLKES